MRRFFWPAATASDLKAELTRLNDALIQDSERYASAAPTTGTWNVGNRVWNSSPVAGGNMGWVCVVAGTPGTWKAFGLIDA